MGKDILKLVNKAKEFSKFNELFNMSLMFIDVDVGIFFFFSFFGVIIGIFFGFVFDFVLFFEKVVRTHRYHCRNHPLLLRLLLLGINDSSRISFNRILLVSLPFLLSLSTT